MVSKESDMINYKTGNVLAANFVKPTLICHIVNTENRFGSGFAAAVAKQYPHVKQAYHDWYQDTMFPCELQDGDIPFMLGKVQPIRLAEDCNSYLVQMIAQSQPGGMTFQIGNRKIFLRPIRLDSLRECLYNVAVVAKQHNMEVAGPMFGSGLAGGKWDEEIVPLINECLCRFDVPVTIYRL